MTRALGLNPKQGRMLMEQRRGAAKEMRKVSQELSKARRHLMQLLSVPDPDSIAVEQAIQQLASAQIEMERQVVRSILEMKETLTPEQQERLLHRMKRGRKWDRFEFSGPRNRGPRSSTGRDQ
jgi:Spy/CpxP family protein refolding chaperone